MEKGNIKLDVIEEAEDDQESDDSGRVQPFYRYVKRRLGHVHEMKKRERSNSFTDEKKSEKKMPID